MSKGLGRIERDILTVLQTRPMATVSIVIAVYGIEVPAASWRYEQDFITDAQHSAVRRALATLKRKGMVEASDRHWRRSQRHWSLPGTFVDNRP